MGIGTVIVHHAQREEADRAAKHLQAASFRTVVAHDAQDIPALIVQEQADAVLLDAEGNPQATWDLCTELRDAQSAKEVGVIVALPAFLQRVSEARTAGATEILVKPLNARELAARVAMVVRLLAARARRRRLAERLEASQTEG